MHDSTEDETFNAVKLKYLSNDPHFLDFIESNDLSF